jgi:hypothetical protein
MGESSRSQEGALRISSLFVRNLPLAGGFFLMGQRAVSAGSSDDSMFGARGGLLKARASYCRNVVLADSLYGKIPMS